MTNNETINWLEIVNAYSSYKGRLIDFCNIKNISKNQLYYRKKFKNQSDVQFHEISIKEIVYTRKKHYLIQVKKIVFQL